MKTKLDWSSLGQFFSTVLGLFTVIRSTFENMQVGMPIVPWLLSGKGEMAFVAALTGLGMQYRLSSRVEVVNRNSLRVYLDAPINLPYPDFTIERAQGGETALVTCSNGQLHVNGRRVVLRKTEDLAAPNRYITGPDLLDRLKEIDSLPPDIIDALLEHPHMIPDQWFGPTYTTICFAAVVFRSPPFNNPGMARFFGKETHMSPSELFLRSLTISDSSAVPRNARPLDTSMEWMGRRYMSNLLFAVLA